MRLDPYENRPPATTKSLSSKQLGSRFFKATSIQPQVGKDLLVFSNTGRSSMAAMIFSSPAPKLGQRCVSMSMTHLS